MVARPRVRRRGRASPGLQRLPGRRRHPLGAHLGGAGAAPRTVL